ncbi:MAG TPA: DMT family transporter [archaeon]|nr:DMT family transporter [archaeon]
MKKEVLGTLLAIIAALFSGIAIPANKIFIVDMDPLVFTAIRAVVIGAAFLAVSYWMRPKQKKTRPISANWKYFAVIAVVGGAIAFYLYFTGLKLTTSGRAAFLHKTLPLYTAILAFIFLKEKITKKYVAAIAIMIAGTCGIYFATINPTEFFSNPQLGDMLVMIAAFLWAIENIAARKVMKNGSSNWVVSFVRMFFGGLVLFGAVIIMGKAGVLMTLTAGQWTNIGISTALLFFYVLFYYWALRLINVSKAAMLLLLAPVISLYVGASFLGEPTPALQLLGSGAILAGAYLAVGVKSEERGI